MEQKLSQSYTSSLNKYELRSHYFQIMISKSGNSITKHVLDVIQIKGLSPLKWICQVCGSSCCQIMWHLPIVFLEISSKISLPSSRKSPSLQQKLWHHSLLYSMNVTYQPIFNSQSTVLLNIQLNTRLILTFLFIFSKIWSISWLYNNLIIYIDKLGKTVLDWMLHYISHWQSHWSLPHLVYCFKNCTTLSLRR